MLNRDDIAHEYMLQFLAREKNQLGIKGVFELLTQDSFNLADAMIAEAQKRKNTERPSVVGDGWISVEDRLPDDGQEVLIYHKNSYWLGLFNLKDNGFECGDDGQGYEVFYKTDNVTHWQDLPSPPKGAVK